MKGFEMSDSDLLVKGACDRLGIQLHSIPTARNTKTYQGRSKCLNYSLCRACPVGAMYSSDQTVDRLREFDNFHLLSKAHVRKVTTASDDRIDAVRYHDGNGREHTLRAGNVILAAQAVENVRILLNSRNARYPNGVANGSGLLGKYLTEHMKFYLMGRVPHKLQPHIRGYETAASQQFQDHPKRGRYSGGRIIVLRERWACSAGYCFTLRQMGQFAKRGNQRNIREFRDAWGVHGATALRRQLYRLVAYEEKCLWRSCTTCAF